MKCFIMEKSIVTNMSLQYLQNGESSSYQKEEQKEKEN
jgi:hypothetical protein